MLELDKMLKLAESNVNEALRHYEAQPGGSAQEFVELKLQAFIFQYDICFDMASVVRSQATGFASCIALKGLVLRMVEYDLALNGHWNQRLIRLGTALGFAYDINDVREASASWKTEFKHLRSWASVRNKAAAHYHKHLPGQVNLLKDLAHDDVMSVARAFLSFNMALLVMLREIGKGLGHEG